MSASQSCQFVLRFNTRAILAVGRLVEKEMQDAVGHAHAAEGGDVDGDGGISKRPASLGAAFDTRLPLLRISMAWLRACQKDIVEYKLYLDPYVSDMHKVLTRCLSLFVQVLSGAEVTSAPYLLPEDVETVGLVSLDDWAALHSSSGDLKPRFDDLGVQRQSSELETLARIYDIVHRGVALVGNDAFPWVANTTQQGSQEVMTISYAEDYQSAGPPMPLPNTARVDVGGLPASIDVPDNTGLDEFASEALGQLRLGQSTRPTGPSDSPGIDFQEPPLGSDLNVDIETYNRVQNFLTPPEIPADAQLRESSSSYGMHSATADEVFGQLQLPTSPAAVPGTAKTFPGLPWDFVFTPTPNRPGQRDITSGVTAGGWQDYPRHAASGSMSSDDGFAKRYPKSKALGG